VSFSEDVRAELAGIAPERECDRLAELSALFHFAGRLHLLGRGEVSLHLDLSSPAAARRAFALLRSFGVRSEIRTYQRHAFGRETRYQLHVEGGPAALEVLQQAGVVDSRTRPLDRPPKRVVSRSCCRSAYVRGALLASGSVSPPPSPHLEVRSETREGAVAVAAAAASEGGELRVAERGDHALAYAKGIDHIAGVLAAAGASGAALALQERAVMGFTRARANRLANADHANLVRASRAAHRQLEAIRRLERAGALGDLPERLREIAELRLRHPSLSLRELAARCRPAATKAAAHRRLARVERIADSLE
jgi:DNA-binding protein WhiA